MSTLVFILSHPAARGRETAEKIVAREPQPVDLVGDKGAELLAPPREAANRSVRLGFEFLPLLDLLEARCLRRLPSRTRADEGVAAEAPCGAGSASSGTGSTAVGTTGGAGGGGPWSHCVIIIIAQCTWERPYCGGRWNVSCKSRACI